jgi:hypothetical protein
MRTNEFYYIIANIWLDGSLFSAKTCNHAFYCLMGIDYKLIMTGLLKKKVPGLYFYISYLFLCFKNIFKKF